MDAKPETRPQGTDKDCRPVFLGGPRDGQEVRGRPLVAEVKFVAGLAALSPHIHLLDHYSLRRTAAGTLQYEYEGRW